MLKGKIVSLRAVEKSDLKQLLIWRNNPKFRIFFRENREINNCNQKQWFENVVKKKAAKKPAAKKKVVKKKAAKKSRR